MSPKNNSLTIHEQSINISQVNGQDYICLTDMARSYGADKVVENWLRNKNTLEFLGVWESLNNPSFNYPEFEGIKNQAGLNRFTISVKEWSAQTNAQGLVAKTGRYGGTYAHKDIAFEFGSWLSPEFRLLIISEFQRLKAQEQSQVAWDANRFLAKVNYRIHTDSIKDNLLPTLQLSRAQEMYVYTDEADMLNAIVFGMPAAQWRKENPEAAKSKNQRDFASLHQLVILANLENLNAHLITEGRDRPERFQALLITAQRQYQSLLTRSQEQDRLENKNDE